MNNNNKSNRAANKLMRVTTKTHIASTALLACFWASHANALCDISPDNRYEFIESISLDGSELTDNAELSSYPTLILQPGYSSYRYREYWSIWIDLNKDGDFSDSGELLYQSQTASNESVTVQLPITEQMTVDQTQMRVLLHSDAVASDSCHYDGYGDEQTVTVSINSNTAPGGGDNNYQLEITPRGGSNEHIASITLGQEQRVSGDNSGYADFTSSTVLNIADGDQIALQPVTSWSTDWAVWIDSDASGSFDVDELVFSGQGRRDATVQGSLDLSTIATGRARMRVAMNGDGTALASGFRYGEIEDYSVNVGEGSGNDDSNEPPVDPGDKLYGSHVQWLHDSVKVKVFRFEFTDAKLSWTVNRIESEMQEIIDYFDEQSYGRFAVNYDIYDSVVQVGESVSQWDNRDPNDWKAYFADKLVALGETEYWNIDDDTIYLILAPQISDWGIKAGVNPGAIRMYDTGDTRSQAGGLAHEMGHAMGLHHAQGLDGHASVFGTGDYDSEMIGYGNAFSLMGNNAWDFGGLNLYYKNFFKSWNITDEVPQVIESGTYRIYALDHGQINGDIGIRLKSGNDQVTYWVEYRTKDGADTNGVQINTEGYFADEDARSYYYGTSFLLDMTPNTFPDDLNDDYDDFDDFMDGALVIGKSYTDKWGAFTITPVNKGGVVGTASAWIDLEVELH